MTFKDMLIFKKKKKKDRRPGACELQLLQDVSLLVRHPAQVQLLLHGVVLLQTEAHWVPARHDVVGDDAAQRVGHDGHLAPVLLELRVARAEERVESVQLLREAFGDLRGAAERESLEGERWQAKDLGRSGLLHHLVPVKGAVVVHDVHGAAVE